MPTSRKSKRKPRLTKAQINYAMMAHVEKRVGALADQYNGLGGAVDAQDLRVRELGQQVAALRFQIGLIFAHFDEMKSAPKPKPWYVRAWGSIVAWFARAGEAFESASDIKLPDYNATHPMTKGGTVTTAPKCSATWTWTES